MTDIDPGFGIVVTPGPHTINRPGNYLIDISSLEIPELGEDQTTVQLAITSLNVQLGMGAVTAVSFSVNDPDFAMTKANYFVAGRQVTFRDVPFEITEISLKYSGTPSVSVVAKPVTTQKLRRDKGARNFGSISPSQFAQIAANTVGMFTFIEPSEADGTIVRQTNEDDEESTFTVLQRLAGELKYRIFEANGILHFASDQFLIKNQPTVTIKLPSEVNDSFYATKVSLSRSDDDMFAGTFSVDLIKTESSLSLYPGLVVKFDGELGAFKDVSFLITNVSYDMKPSSLVRISGTTPEDAEEDEVEGVAYSPGSTGKGVERIQAIVGVAVDGVWGPRTTRAVERWQSLNQLPVDGVWNEDDWEKAKSGFLAGGPARI